MSDPRPTPLPTFRPSPFGCLFFVICHPCVDAAALRDRRACLQRPAVPRSRPPFFDNTRCHNQGPKRGVVTNVGARGRDKCWMVGTDTGDLGLPVPPFQLAQQRLTRPREGQSAGNSIRNRCRPWVPPCRNGKLGTSGRGLGQRWPPTCWQRRIAGTPSTVVGARARLLGQWQSVHSGHCDASTDPASVAGAR